MPNICWGREATSKMGCQFLMAHKIARKQSNSGWKQIYGARKVKEEEEEGGHKYSLKAQAGE